MQAFYLGIHMPVTISTGAYTAGVMDFLIEAMDSWYGERAAQREKYGDHYSSWTIPPHELQLSVLTGASGGGMVASVVAAALSQKFEPAHQQSPHRAPGRNPLFRSWVAGLDPIGLLDSIGLDWSSVPDIVTRAARVEDPLPARRQWVRDGLRVLLPLMNLRGVPYAIEPQALPGPVQTLSDAHRRAFEVNWDKLPSKGETVTLSGRGGSEWQTLAQSAFATGALPLAQAARTLTKVARQYDLGQMLSFADSGDGQRSYAVGEKKGSFRPVEDSANETSFPTGNVDGDGAYFSTFDCTQLELASLPRANSGGCNKRDPNVADQAVVSIAPLRSNAELRLPKLSDERLTSILGELVNALVNQDRIQGENLTSDAAIAGRWIISPTAEAGGSEPLAGTLLGGFSGFLSPLFREHDYQLGRRNCQRFLTSHFGLPWTNPIVQQYGLSAEAQSRIDGQYGFDIEGTDRQSRRQRMFPLIPLLPQLRQEIRAVRRAVDQDALARVIDTSLDRLKGVAKALLRQHGSGHLSEFAFTANWPRIRRKIRDPLLTHVIHELAGQGFANRSGEPDLLAELQRLRNEIASLRKDLL